jgi:ArsR family transcriptional regulator
MAEALLRHKAGDKYDVYSAGTQPDAVDPRAINALGKFGLDTNNLVSKNMNVAATPMQLSN